MFRVLILSYFDLTLQVQFFLSDLSLSENMTIYRIVLELKYLRWSKKNDYAEKSGKLRTWICS